MSEPSLQDAKTKLEKHIRFLINQPIIDFQVNHDVKIKEIKLTYSNPIMKFFRIKSVEVILIEN